MLARPTTANLSGSKLVKSSPLIRKAGTANSSASRMSSLQRIYLQQQRPFGSPSLWQSRRRVDSPQIPSKERSTPIARYHPWNDEYSQIITRDKRLKSMTKDPYTPLTRLISHAEERVVTEPEYCWKLIPAKDVQIKQVKVYQSIQPRQLLPKIIRYVRRGDLMPSEQRLRKLDTVKVTFSSELVNNEPITPIKPINTITGVTPTLTIKDRLLNRAKLRTDSSVIRRPPRKLKFNPSRETIVPLSVYG